MPRALVVAALVLLPRIVDACPYCAAGDDGTDATSRLIVLGSLILLPFAVAGVVAFAIRRMLRGSEPKQIDPFE